MPKTWSKIEVDALTEFFNLGLGRAASTLNELSGQHIDLHTPNIEFCPTTEILKHVTTKEGELIISIKLDFDGVIYGDSFLIFPEDEGLKLVDVIIGDGLSEEDRADLLEDTLSELGNIILNACLSSFCDTLDFTLENGLPTFSKDNHEQFIKNLGQVENSIGIVAQVEFKLQESDIAGHIIIFMEKGSISSLRAKVTHFVRGF